MGQYAPDPNNDQLMANIRDLERRIKSLETSAPQRSMSISDGGQMIVRGRDGKTLVLLGRIDNPARNAPDGKPQMGFYLFRSTGEIALSVEDALPTVDGFQQYLALWDRSGNIIAGDDTTSGQGLARPWLPVPFYDYPAEPTQTTTSTSFTTLQRAAAYPKQLPQITVGVVVETSAGTTGEVRLFDTTHGAVVGSVLSIPANTFAGYNIGPAPIGGNHMDGLDLDIQARRTGGTGTVGVRVVTAYGVQS